jgi:hypothetical protein
VSKHRAPRRLGRRTATPVAALALSAAALTAVAPMASAHTTKTHDHDWDHDSGDVGVLNHSTLLPVQACGTQVPILSGILGGNADHAACGQAADN